MTSLQGAIHAVALADTTPSVGFVALVADGAVGILGGDSSEPPPATNALWAVLTLQGDAPSLSPNTVDGVFRWWLYDDKQWGYTRLNAAAGRLLRLYPEATGHLYRDPVTLEEIWWQGAGLLGPPTVADEYPDTLLRWVDFPCRKTHLGHLLAA
jgi:hypothetical protein